MTIGIAACGPKAGLGVLAGLRAVEQIGRGAVGGFASFVALGPDGQVLRAATQTGGAEALLSNELPQGAATAPLAGLISSGPNRPEPLSDFIAAEPGVGLVTGHRMPQTRNAEGVPLNAMVLAEMRQGADPQTAVTRIISRYPDMDAGFIACSIDGRLGLGNTPAVKVRRDQGGSILEGPDGTISVASIHNAIHPHRIVSALANEVTLDRMIRPETPLAWIRFVAGVRLEHAPSAEVHVDASGALQRVGHPQRSLQSGKWSAGLGDRVAVLSGGHQTGWLGYEPFMSLLDGQVLSVDGQDEILVPVLRTLPGGNDIASSSEMTGWHAKDA